MFSRTLRSLEGYEPSSYKILPCPVGNESAVMACAYIVDNFEGTSKNDEVNFRRFQDDIRICLESQRAQVQKYWEILVANTRRTARVIIFGRASVYNMTTLCVRASNTEQGGGR